MSYAFAIDPANPNAGLSGLSLYVPRPRVELDALAGWTGADPAKLRAVVGDAFRVPQPDEDVYTMAAAAVLRLLRAYEVDPARVGMLALGTESSLDNAVGAVIVRGMVDDALRQAGRAPLPRAVEVPEVKHACLGGMYALKSALRYVQTDGADRVAIVVAADIAQYERGSSGEPTQGAGAVAMLVEPRARLLALDLRTSGSSSDERGWDFRKPTARHFMAEYPESCRGERDFPVFNGKYSTVCYVEAVVRALHSAHARRGGDPRALLRGPAALLLHRPYDRMPLVALGAAWVWACVRADARDALAPACAAAGVSFDDLAAELDGECRAREGVRAHGPEFDPLARTQAVARQLAKDPGLARVLEATQPGRAIVRQLGNLYTASLPAWLAAAFADAHTRALAWDDAAVTLIGYGSGDAAEVWSGRVVPGWRELAGRIAPDRALAGPIDLTREEYEALHERRAPARELPAPTPFAVAGRGHTYDRRWQDVGVAHYRVVEPT
jgi:hydroxymethylglutaryl-CoA synthase